MYFEIFLNGLIKYLLHFVRVKKLSRRRLVFVDGGQATSINESTITETVKSILRINLSTYVPKIEVNSLIRYDHRSPCEV